jgi:predicted transcriptional regulator
MARRARGARPVTRIEYEVLRQRIEDLEDVVLARSIEATSIASNRLPIALVERMVSGEHPARVWREHRGLSLNALARRAGVAPGYLSDIEHRKKPGSVAVYRALAKALGIAIDDLT